MTSAVGEPKSRRKEHNQLIWDSDKGEEVKENQKILLTSYMEDPNRRNNLLLPNDKMYSMGRQVVKKVL